MTGFFTCVLGEVHTDQCSRVQVVTSCKAVLQSLFVHAAPHWQGCFGTTEAGDIVEPNRS